MNNKKLIEAFKEWLKKNEPVIAAQIDQDGAVMACVAQKAFIAGAMHKDGKEQWPEDVAENLDPTAIQGGVVGKLVEPDEDWWNCLIEDVITIDCWYRGDPSYEHDAYWMRETVVKMLEKRRDESKTDGRVKGSAE